MGIKLVVEVLDHYHGTDARKVWLTAWAEKANDRTWRGWPGRALLMRRTDKSATRVSHIAAELIAEGALKRVEPADDAERDRFGRNPCYEMLSLDGAELTHPPSAELTHPPSAELTHPRARKPRTVQSAPRNRESAARNRESAAISPRPAETPPIPHNPQQPSSSTRRTSRTGSKRPAAATYDDDNPQTSHKPDPRAILDGLDPGRPIDDDLAAFILALIEADPSIPDAADHLLAIAAKPADEIRGYLGRERRALDRQDADDDRPRPPQPARPPTRARPPWCGECDERTRLVTVYGDTPADDRIEHCIRCHPLSARPPEPAEPAGPIWLKPWCGQCDTPATRWAEVGQPDGTVKLARCPECGAKRR